MMGREEAVELYEVWETRSRWDMPASSTKRASTHRYRKALREKEQLEQNTDYGWNNVRFDLYTRLLTPDEAERAGLQRRPENFIHLDEVEPIDAACGRLYELYASDNMSLAYLELHGRGDEHKHHYMEETYHVTQGQGSLYLDDQRYTIEEGDTIAIPTETWHRVESRSPLEILVVTHPRFDAQDVIPRYDTNV